VGASVLKYPGRGLRLPRMQDIPPIAPSTKKRSSGKKGKKNKTSWEYGRLTNSFRDITEITSFEIPKMSY